MAARTVKRAVERHGLKDILLVAPTSRDLTKTLAPAIIDSYPDGHPNKPELKVGYIKWKNGATAVMIPAEAGENSPRGGNAQLSIYDEFCFYGRNEGIITQAMLATRIAPAKNIAISTPKAVPQLLKWKEMWEAGDESIQFITGNTFENSHNLSGEYIKVLKDQYAGTRLEKVELYGELHLENPGALFTMSDIEKNIVDPSDVPPLVEYGAGVDPALISKDASKVGSRTGRKPDDVGIVVSGMDKDGIIYVLDDFTKGYPSADMWARRVADLYKMYSAKAKTNVTIERNNIGDELINHLFERIGEKEIAKKFRTTFSTQSKLQRLSPAALLHDKGLIKWVCKGKNLDGLFMELTTFSNEPGSPSPNSLDAFVFSIDQMSGMNKRETKSIKFLL